MSLRESMAEEVRAALGDLEAAVEELIKETTPPVPLPRPRVFEIAPDITWPYREEKKIKWKGIYIPCQSPWEFSNRNLHSARTAKEICQACRWRPRLVVRAIRRIEAAAAWCRRRAEGRRRAAKEILQQQRDALKKLQARTALRELAGEET